MRAGESSAEVAPTFEGFVTGGAAVTVPAQFFVELLPAIEDEAELRTTLYALYAIGRQRGSLRGVRRSELERARPLLRALEPIGGAPVIARALEGARARGTLLSCDLEDGDALYLVNSDAGRRSLLRVRAGAQTVPGVGGAVAAAAAPQPDRPRAAAAYEQEIGVLTPAVAEALAEAIERYPEHWVVEALQEAARSNARSWRYAEAILRRWERDGRSRTERGGDDATAGGTTATSGRERGPYERVVRRS